MKVDLSEEEIKLIADILKYSVGNCPVESISDRVNVSEDKIEELAARLDKVADAPAQA